MVKRQGIGLVQCVKKISQQVQVSLFADCGLCLHHGAFTGKLEKAKQGTAEAVCTIPEKGGHAQNHKAFARFA